MELKNFIKQYNNAISTEICESLVKKFNLVSKQEKHENTLYKFYQVNLNKNLSTFQPEFNLLLDEFISHFRKYAEELRIIHFPSNPGFEELRIKRYPIDGYFNEHVDVSNADNSKRFLSAFVYLNDSGGTQFFDELIKAETGKLVIFPPLWMFPHSGIVGDKPKYFLSTYLHYLT